MISANVHHYKRSRYPYAPLKSRKIPALLSLAGLDRAFAQNSIDERRATLVLLDLEHRLELDLTTTNHTAERYAAALGQIDALHIEWGLTHRDNFDQLVFWERLGAILRRAGV